MNSARLRPARRSLSRLPCLVAFLAAAALASACGSASTSVVAPTTEKCQISVTGFTGAFGAAGGNGSATIDAARECGWAAAVQTGWISLSPPTSGTGVGKVTFSVAANGSPRARSGTLRVNDQPLTVSQEAAPCRFTVTPVSFDLGATGGGGTVTVGASDDTCGWNAASQADWVVVSGPAARSGNGTVAFAVGANPGAAHSTTLSIAGQAVSVAQAGAVVNPPVRLSGTVARRRGGCPTISFTVQNTSVVTTADTVFAGGTCDSLKNGDRVIVEGAQAAGQPVVATRVTTTGG
jgi:hypothetical protein